MNRLLISRILTRRQTSRHPRVDFFSRRYNGQAQPGSHTTYFPPVPEPPRSKSGRFGSFALAASFFVLGGITCVLALPQDAIAALIEDDASAEPTKIELAAELVRTQAKLQFREYELGLHRTPMAPESAEYELQLRSDITPCATHLHYTTRLPSNAPCEDVDTTGGFSLPQYAGKPASLLAKSAWTHWMILDGHGGPLMSHTIPEFIGDALHFKLFEAGCLERPYTPNDPHIIRTIQRVFTDLDSQMGAEPQKFAAGLLPLSTDLVVNGSLDSAGSCVIAAIFDPVSSVLRVANAGDSRAVLGRWDESAGRYVAIAMSNDHTGFNKSEVARLRREHPGEDVVDANTGRLFGLAVTRAFGDFRWKWPAKVSEVVHEQLWGAPPRPDGVIKTPPYITAEPEVIETRIVTEDKPDFLIMASDGLWDKMSSEDAVLCVDQWLQKNGPADLYVSETNKEYRRSKGEAREEDSALPVPVYTENEGAADENLHYDGPADEGLYYDENEKATLWKADPKYFVNEDDHPAAHLVKNALGGSRRGLFLRAMTMRPPLSRAIRDDITVTVTFFGIPHDELPIPRELTAEYAVERLGQRNTAIGY